MRLWQDLTTDEFTSLDPNHTVALLPAGATEQHGPHLPLATDSVIAEELARRAAREVPPPADVLVLPTVAVGKSTEHTQYPGTLTHSARTLLDAWMEIGESVARSGVRKLMFLNAHGGQPQVMEIVARELRIAFDLMVVGCSAWSLGKPDTEVPDDERRHGIHAGTVETSMMLYLRPDLVRMDKAKNFKTILPEVEAKYEYLRVVGTTYLGWQAQDLHPDGAAGDATKATAEIGRIYTEYVVPRLAKLIAEVADYPLTNIRNRPTGG